MAKMTKADKECAKLFKKAEEKNLYLDGAVGNDDFSWSVAISASKETINSEYIIIDYCGYEDEEQPWQLSYYNMTDSDNIIEGVAIGDYKTLGGALKKIIREIA